MRIVPLAAEGVAVDAASGGVTLAGDGVQAVVRPSVWSGSPAFLPEYVTPFHLFLVNGGALPLAFTHADLRLFDEAGFQYTALPPADVERILRAASASAVTVTAGASLAFGSPGRRWAVRDPFWAWDWWWWGHPFGPYPYYPPRLDDVYLRALPVGVLQPAARTEGFVYFPRLRPEARQLRFEFHHRLGDTPRVLTAPFGVRRTERRGGPATS